MRCAFGITGCEHFMAQWIGQYSGLTHETKVQDLETSLRKTVAACATAPEAERESRGKAVEHLAGRLLAARLKAIRARLSALREPGQKRASEDQLKQLQTCEQELLAQGVAGILKEFHFHEANKDAI